MKNCTVCGAQSKRAQCSDECRRLNRNARQKVYADKKRDALREYAKTYYQANADRLKAQQKVYKAGRARENRGYSLKHHYGITIDEYEAMLESQDHQCAACGDPLEKPHVDHDHSTGRVRELLCPPCNLAIGHLKDDPDRAMRLALYLERHRVS